MTRHGAPDRSRCARIILNDFVAVFPTLNVEIRLIFAQGRLLFCHCPPGMTQSEFAPPLKNEESDDEGEQYSDRMDEFEEKNDDEDGSNGEEDVRFDLESGEDVVTTHTPNAYSKQKTGRKTRRRDRQKYYLVRSESYFHVDKYLPPFFSLLFSF